MKNERHRDRSDDAPGWIDTELSRFGFDDTWDTWMDRIREIESPSPLGSIGQYEILREVARGGQGIVYKARRSSTGDIFALKRLIGGFYASAESRQRLERELEVAATLDSPHIVRVFGIDIIDDQPVLAMEWVEGQSITKWAAARGDRLRDCLSVFAAVCDSVHHAHRRGVLHRDLKPSNIMVDKADCPHLLDFGLAAFMTGSNGEKLTQSGLFIGTPDYSSPERLASGGAFADVRCDVYSLGVVLHEILAGQLPYPPYSHDPARWSATRLSAAPRPSKVVPGLAGDLDSIVLKGLDPDPDRRYQSAQALGDDIRRHLAGEPLEARPPGTIALARQFLRRHRIAATFGITVALLLSGWGIVAGVLTVRLAERTRAAEAAQRTTERINSFLMNVLVSPRPARAGSDMSVLSLLEYAASRADKDLSDAPSVRAEVHASLGRTYQTLGKNVQAAASLRKAVDLYRVDEQSGDQLFQALLDLSGALSDLRDTDAVKVASQAVELAEETYGRQSARAASASAWLASALWRSAGQKEEAERLLRDAIDRLDAVWPSDLPLLATHHGSLALMLDARGDYAGAQREFDRALVTLRKYSDSNSEFAQALGWSLGAYSHTLLAMGQPAQAESVLVELRPLQRRLYGSNKDAMWCWWMAHVDAAQGRGGDAIAHAHEALAAAWRLSEVQPEAGSDDCSEFFAKSPLAANPAGYSNRVYDALLRKGEEPRAVRRSMTWLSELLIHQGHPLHGAAVVQRAAQIPAHTNPR